MIQMIQVTMVYYSILLTSVPLQSFINLCWLLISEQKPESLPWCISPYKIYPRVCSPYLYDLISFHSSYSLCFTHIGFFALLWTHRTCFHLFLWPCYSIILECYLSVSLVASPLTAGLSSEDLPGYLLYNSNPFPHKASYSPCLLYFFSLTVSLTCCICYLF